MLKGKVRSFVLILMLVAVVALIGCGGSETKVDADQVVQDALAAQAEVDTSHVEMSIVADADGTLNGADLDASLNATMKADIDWTNKKMYGDLGLNASYNGLAFPISVDMYAVDNCSYIQMQFGTMTDNWTKSEFPVDFWFSQNQDSQQFIDSLLQSTEAESLPDQKVDGVSCYVLKLTPNYAALQQMLEQQAGGEEIPDIASLISSLSIKVWVAKDTSYVTKIEVKLVANIPAEVIGGTAGGEGLAIDLTITMEMMDVNEAVSIELPAEAANAEFGNPFDMFSGFSF